MLVLQRGIGLLRMSHALRSLAMPSLLPSFKIHRDLSSKKEEYDIIICGGGMVGTALACSLAKSKTLADRRILLLDASPAFKGFDNGAYKNRVSAVNNSTIELFKSIDAWDYMLKTRVKAVKQMQVWDASSDALIQFHHEQFSSDVAFIVENDLIMEAMYRQIKPIDRSHLSIVNDALVKSVKLRSVTNARHNELVLSNGDVLTCELLVGADGMKSLIRQEMGVDVYAGEYDHKGLVATVELHESTDNSVAWQRFIPTGPVALLPLNDTMSSLVWSTSKQQADNLVQMPSEKFVDELNSAFYKSYPKSEAIAGILRCIDKALGGNVMNQQLPPKIQSVVAGSRAAFPLGFLHASSYVAEGVALVGDAAHRIHPLAGQGVNLGFSDVEFLVSALNQAVYSGTKLGDKHYLLKYERNSLSKNVPIIMGVHALQRMYSTTFMPVVLLRSVGLQLTQNISPIKDIFMRRAIC